MSAGMIVRMIDIVMILLFGFICTAELSSQGRIELPTTVELPPSNPDPEVVIFVGITPTGVYLLGGDEKKPTPDIEVLERFLMIKKSELAQTNYKMRVRMRADFSTPIRFIMQAADICDRLEVLKTVDVRIGSKYTR